MPFSNGTQISDAGQMSTLGVPEAYVPIGTDVYINGTLHSEAGVRYITMAAPSVTRQFINGILHTDDGVMYGSTGAAVHDWPEGLQTDANGALIVSEALGVQQGFVHGIAIGDSGAFVTDDGTGGAGDNLLIDDVGNDALIIEDATSDVLLIQD